MAEPTLQITYVDRLDVSETFADSVEKIAFDGQVWRFEFCVTRMDDPNPPVMRGRKYPACRLVLGANAGMDLANKLRGMLEMMEKQGLVKQVSPADIILPPGTKPN